MSEGQRHNRMDSESGGDGLALVTGTTIFAQRPVSRRFAARMAGNMFKPESKKQIQ
jgi:hypothetical protein